MDEFEILERVGEGVFGVVVKAKHIKSNTLVALKRVSFGDLKQGIPIFVVREIQSLRHIGVHNNIIGLKAVIPHSPGLILVLDYMHLDLEKFLSTSPRPLAHKLARDLMRMILQGLKFAHQKGIMHRDIKPSNILVSEDATLLKIGDWGLSRIINAQTKENTQNTQHSNTTIVSPITPNSSSSSPSTNPHSPFPSQTSSHLTNTVTHSENINSENNPERLLSLNVATRWYKSPELLWGSRNYDSKVDVWAAACVFAELLGSNPLFPGETDINQLWHIICLLGTPNETIWPDITLLPDYGKIVFDDLPAKPLSQAFPSSCPPLALDLLKKMLQWDPFKRPTASEILEHHYFKENFDVQPTT